MWGLVKFVERGQLDDERKLSSSGVRGSTPEAVPHYTRWIREDLVGMFYMMNIIVIMLVLIAIPLWMIALR
jgi:hypothetical protein